MEKTQECYISGRNPVYELLGSGRSIEKIYVKKGDKKGSLSKIIHIAHEKKIDIVEVDQTKLDFLSDGVNNQGVVALASSKDLITIDELISIAKNKSKMPTIVILDGIEDPGNFGAIVRCSECLGVDGIIIPKHHSAPVNGVAYKTSAGALEYVPVSRVVNLSVAIEKLKDNGFWIFSAETGGDNYYNTDFKCPTALVLGSEGNGVSRIVKENSDFIVSIPMSGNVNSLNVSAAAAIILAEISKQHNN